MDLGLEDKVALVTGAGSQIGFGKAIALTLAKEGCDIIVNDVNLEGAEKTAAEVRALGRRAIAIKANIASSSEVNDMVKAALTEFGRIDILVNNAGVGFGGGPLTQTKEKDWDALISINIKGPMNCSKAVLPQMLSRQSGKIINIASGVGKSGMPNNSVYAATKAAVIGFTKSLAAEVAPKGINVNCVAPGLSATNFIRGPDGNIRNPNMLESVKATIPLGRTTEPQDIANMVTYLASDAASDIIGQPFSVEGGRFMM
ncbi:SDR family NAD(P)-dependent oxidoreductase [Chloroflexota bacterium]